MRWRWGRSCQRWVTNRRSPGGTPSLKFITSLQHVLFSPNTDALTPLRSHATPDRAPDHLSDGTPAALPDDLIALLGPPAVLLPKLKVKQKARSATLHPTCSMNTLAVATTLRRLPRNWQRSPFIR